MHETTQDMTQAFCYQNGDHNKKTRMKILNTLIASLLLTGCAYLDPMLNPDIDNIKSEPEQTVSGDKKTAATEKNTPDTAKVLTPTRVDTLPPLSAADPGKSNPTATNKSASTPAPTAAKVDAKAKPAAKQQKFVPGKVLKVGSHGFAVMEMEDRLRELRYDVGKSDGYFDKQTRQAVLAFQKYYDLKRTGTYTLETQKALYEATLAEGEHPELGLPRIEVDLTRQVLLFFDEEGLNRVIAISSGNNHKYCERSKKSGQRVCGVATTPTGKFKIQRKIPGWRESDLGKLYNPLYFNGGFAIHGAPSVPAYNASHGCVRVSVATAVWLYDTVAKGTPVIVFE